MRRARDCRGSFAGKLSVCSFQGPTTATLQQSPLPDMHASHVHVKWRVSSLPISTHLTAWKLRVPLTVFASRSGRCRLTPPSGHQKNVRRLCAQPSAGGCLLRGDCCRCWNISSADPTTAAPPTIILVTWLFTTALSPSDGPFPCREPKKFLSSVQCKSCRAHEMSTKGPLLLYWAPQPSVH